MNLRSVILGLSLAVFIALATYFNDWVIVQTHLVGNHLPIGVFGVLVLFLLLINPMLGLIGRRWMLGSRELAIVCAIGLMACVWAGSNFYRTFVSNMVFPANDMRAKSSWQSAQVMSYLPGGSADVAEGHVTNWTQLLALLDTARTEPASELEKQIAATLDDESRAFIRHSVDADRLDESDRRRLLDILNRAVVQPTGEGAAAPFHQRFDASGERIAHYLSQRDQASAEVEVLQVQQSNLVAQRDELREQYDAPITTLREREAELTQEVESLNRRLGESPDDEALRSELLAIEKQRAEVRDELGQYRDIIAPIERDIQRTNWRIDYYQSKAQRAERHANRAAAVTAADGLLLPAPMGQGLLLNDGFVDPFATDVLVQGWDGDRPLGLRDLGWWAWWPTIKTWGVIAVLLTVGMLFLSMIVHPQWSRRELLTYPVVRFVESATEPGQGLLPKVMASKLFWIGFLLVVFIHTWNGLNKWYPGYLLDIPLTVDASGLRSLFPEAARTPVSWKLWWITITPSLVGFAYFLNKDVSLSVGLSMPAWAVFGGILIGNGIAIENNASGSEMMAMFRFGTYLGLTLILLYIGRRYYANVLLSSVGVPRAKETPAYATWAMRGMLVCLVISGWWLNTRAGLDWPITLLFMMVFIVMSLGMARIIAETGAFFVQVWFAPIGVITALLGVSGLGPEAYFALALAGAVMMNDPRESAMPFFVNALNLGDRVGKASPAKTATPLVSAVVLTFVLAGGATLYWQYSQGSGTTDTWARGTSNASPNAVESAVTQLQSRGELTDANMLSGLERFAAGRPMWSGIAWIVGGVGVVIAVSMLRLRLSWWPIHPVLFMLWGTYPLNFLWSSFLLGWLIKVAVTKFAGARGYHTAIPLMVGLVAGELLAAFGWTLVGATYYFITGNTPVGIRILPG